MQVRDYTEMLGQRLQARRLERNISQEVMAEKIGLSRRAYQHMEKGRGGSLLAFLKALRVLGAADEVRQLLLPKESFASLKEYAAADKKRQRAHMPKGAS